MFLVSNVEMLVASSEAGAIGATPSLNWRPSSEFKKAINEIKSKTSKPVCVNIIVNKSNTRRFEDLKHSLDAGVDMFITSLGNPKHVIEDAHKNGAKVFCDVTNLEHAKKVRDLGADGLIAVGTGAGGHAGPITPFVLIPWLKSEIELPVIAAGGIANGETLAAALALGADGVSVGTRFIASKEAKVDQNYKQAIINANPEDIVMTTRISGTPATVINTEYVKKMGLELPWIVRKLKSNKLTKDLTSAAIHLMGMKNLEQAANKPTWKNVWSAGQTVGLIDDEVSCKEIIERFVKEYYETLERLKKTSTENNLSNGSQSLQNEAN